MDTQTSTTDKALMTYIGQQMELRNVTQLDLQNAIGRSKGYISDRVLGKRSWAISELDRIAPLLGLPNALTLIVAATTSVGEVSTPPVSAQYIADHQDQYDVAAKTGDIEAEQESMEASI